PPASGSKQPAYGAKLRFETAFENLLVISTQEVYLTLDFKFEDRIVYTETRNVLALSGINYVDFDVTLPEARLWWPNGAGEQPLYTAVLSVKGERQTVKTDPVRFGIRTIKLDTSKCNGGGEGSADGQSSVSGKSSAGSESGNKRNFAFIVNGIRIYCKGGNWIPADSIYARVSPQKYRTLISEARECNFNMLRIWGGGIYERDEFYDYCDESGILVWHDFMFACSHYPDDQRWFTELVRSEIDYQTKRLRGHPCLALWCGNNENPMMLYNRYFKKFLESGITGGYYLYNELIPSIIRSNCPEIPYWPSSPYGGEDPNGNDAGDRHHWDDCTMNPDMEKRITPEEYDKITSGFISEYGYIGPCSDASIKKYFGDNPIDRNGSIWDLHNNTFEKATVPEGIRKHYADPEKLPLKDYLRYARLVQGLMYSYSLESIRFCPNNNGSLFWMYNDTWGEVGWTIIDYYLDRKPSYYYIKRAFAPVKFILRRSADKKKILVMGCNDTNADKKIELEYGYVSFTGKYDTVKKIVDLPAFSKGIVLVFDMPKGDLKNGLVFARGGQAPLAVLRTNAYRDYAAAASIVTVKKVETAGRDAAVTLASSGYSHAVSLGLKPGVHPEDDYFDMLPSEVRVIKILDAAGLIKSGKIETDKIKPIYLNTSNKY
ncbi:MAG: beta-mannosidase, partial [Treponema sp.]|nr:beta-mannosidase [Treponema sp.]